MRPRVHLGDVPSFAVHDVPDGPIVLAIYAGGRLEAERTVSTTAALVIAEELLRAARARLQQRGGR